MKISTIRKFAKNPFMLCLMVFSILSSSMISVNAAPIAPTTDFSQADLFNAIYFLDGELVDQIPTLSKIKSKTGIKKSRADRATQATVTSNVNKIDPSFQARLYKAVKSGDQYSISTIIREGGELVLLGAGMTVNPKDAPGFPDLSEYNMRNSNEREQAIQAMKDYNDGGGVQAIIVLVMAVYYYLALYVLVVVAIHDPGNEVFKAVSGDQTITHERLVNELAGL